MSNFYNQQAFGQPTFTDAHASGSSSGRDTFDVIDSSDLYYDPNGTTKGVSKAKKPFKGTWTVNGNEFCMSNKAKGDPKTYTDCNQFWRSGKKVYSLWSVHYDGSKPNKVNDYSPNEMKNFKQGDLVSKRYIAMGGE